MKAGNVLITIVVVTAICMPAWGTGKPSKADKPNIIYIMMDE